MAEPPAIDASPLIVTARTGYLHLLRVLGDRIVVPRPVADEVMRRPDDPAARALRVEPWLEVVEVGEPEEAVLAYRLGRGETAVLSWGLTHPSAETIIDDRRAYRAAVALGLPVIGTLGVVLAARADGLISAARPVIEDLRRSGLYLTDQVLAAALQSVGE
jgi:predicted nucleic acid-binding protein